MTVLILSACPAGLRGDVTKWLAEIKTGVYLGQITQRTREALWKRVCASLSTGEATMVFTARNEQGYSIYTHHTAFVPVDFDGLVLMKRPLPPSKETTGKPPSSKEDSTAKVPDALLPSKETTGKPPSLKEESPAKVPDALLPSKETTGKPPSLKEASPAKVPDALLPSKETTGKPPSSEKESMKKDPATLLPPKETTVPKTKKPQKSKAPPLPYIEWPETLELPASYAVLDMETTGLHPDENEIIEIGCVLVRNHMVAEEFHCLIQHQADIPSEITQLTGITKEILDQEGIPLEEALHQLIPILHNNVLVGHYVAFDIRFLQAAFRKLEIEWQELTAIDTVTLSKKFLAGLVNNYRLETLIRFFEIGDKQDHRALNDAELTMKLYEKLNEKQRIS